MNTAAPHNVPYDHDVTLWGYGVAHHSITYDGVVKNVSDGAYP
jgi:hypothetical protein